MDNVKNQVARELLRIQAVKVQPDAPFTWASGWLSPFYCDNRKALSFPEVRSLVRDSLCNVISQNFPEFDVIAGVATGAIAQGALVADRMGKPFVYVRSAPKDHGLSNLIEGYLEPGSRVMVVEDLVSTGLSSLKAVDAIRNAGCEVIEIFGRLYLTPNFRFDDLFQPFYGCCLIFIQLLLLHEEPFCLMTAQRYSK